MFFACKRLVQVNQPLHLFTQLFNMSAVASVTNDILKKDDNAVNKKAQQKMRKRNKKKSKKQRQEEEAQRKAVSKPNGLWRVLF